MKYIAPTEEMFFEKVESYIHNEDSLKLIRKAYDYAYKKHEGQFRKSGEPYFVHIISVAYELAKLNCGPKTIVGGLLHDVLEDCGVTKEEFLAEFDEDIYNLDEAVTKIGALKFKDEKEYQAANHRKIFIAMAKDIRVILIKLVDRLHNMRTLEFQPPEKQQRIAKETLEVYAPIAHRLGIAEIKNELEDLCFLYLNPEKYHEIAHLVESKKQERDEQVKNMISDISEMLRSHNIPFRIFGRSKHLYSIYNKMVKKNKRFDEILDLLAIRIVTQSELNCYEILGYIHNAYPPIPGRLKDYIAVPKSNLYRSLHTTVIGHGGKIFEIQIRTEEMDEVAEKGVAAHWAYKEGNYDSHQEQKEIVKELNWLKEFEDSDKSDGEYMETVIGDVFNATVYVMTPKGRIIDLPPGSTPIDFAYRVHTDVGHQTVGALVNGIMVPLNTELKTGDVVELKTNKNSSPSEDWLKIVKTKQARSKINTFFQKKELEEKAESIKLGEEYFEEAFKKENLNPKDFLTKDKLEKIYSEFAVKNYNDLMFAIGVKSLSPYSIIEKLVKTGKKELDKTALTTMITKNKSRQKAVSKYGVVVNGISDVKISLASCCAPIYGDLIVGFVSQGQGIKVHRDCCPNILNKKRLIYVEWADEKPDIKYCANIKVIANDRNFLLTDLVTCISQFKASLTGVNISVDQETLTATALISLMIEDKEHLDNIMSNLKKVSSVIDVTRTIK
ncbi:MAG: bifunctional (p)ppGpp synthetase/guanosine-3',5'-bis(diphosphate) 3'-pyrophosphohydrolase [Solobacterium sp.]|nr:bifunctional (p)ppGpp synthetase/guanosine-3',5'-bis(diphosphate) 3'-pyrophosphohydrolase [Solobacterium sp.]MDD5983366.1 bifunctional (p)ppGpp synthetase/guanosine-3',5'-bis(diphosphate) 3'-pyrophosphohydrolase [Solobacterium sp.]MDD6835127.1 bifunctional (p)ppGpp synthetase/guanosine-3',5'-bis(diphosphate) 3'-pyrophosphohydrolase [Solobacterium sp.]MDD6885947.1 bifunctional (p)ppGpp synthetase/guanosine-3',5'-bis(diphosphate) 3'-pyrophosphohydrolase [Solobacterium sp.]MDY5653896.1 bifuncti